MVIGIGIMCVVAVLINAAVTYQSMTYMSGLVAEDKERVLSMQMSLRAACLALADQTGKLEALLNSPPVISVGQGELLKAYHPDDEEEAHHLMTIYRDRGLLPGISGQDEDFEDGRGY
jgi:hypothetical protein